MLSIVVALFLAQQSPIVLTAKSANVSDAGTPVKINLLRWSTDEERNPIVIALDPAAQAAQAARGGRGGRGARAAGGLDPNDPALADTDATPAPARGGGRGGRGGGGRGGRGGDAAA